jgi:hypothetical protein
MELLSIYNGDGMCCRYSYAVYDGEELLALDLIGAESEVKALNATLVQRKPVTLKGTWGRKRVGREQEIDVLRTALEDRPPLYRWHVVPIPSEQDPGLVVYGWEDILPPAGALVGALANWTVWPTLPEWGEALYRLGREADLVQAVERAGVDYAFRVWTAGWDDVIDRAIRDGQLSFRE